MLAFILTGIPRPAILNTWITKIRRYDVGTCDSRVDLGYILRRCGEVCLCSVAPGRSNGLSLLACRPRLTKGPSLEPTC